MDERTVWMLDRLIEREGGYVNDSADPGGETKFGISKRSHPELDIKNLTLEQAREIYFTEYVKAHKIDLLPEWLQEVVLDWTVHSGSGVAVKELQRMLGVKAVDGKIGFETALAARGVGNPISFVRLYQAQRIRFMGRIVRTNKTLSKFLPGWLNRVLDLLPL